MKSWDFPKIFFLKTILENVLTFGITNVVCTNGKKKYYTLKSVKCRKMEIIILF